MLLTLSRIQYTPNYTLGHLLAGKYTFDTLELPWRNNHHDKSCIPPGSYPVMHYTRLSGNRVLLVEDVPDREGIEIHIGNYLEETHGCILVGSSLGFGYGMPFLRDSHKAMCALLQEIGVDTNLTLLVVGDLPAVPVPSIAE